MEQKINKLKSSLTYLHLMHSLFPSSQGDEVYTVISEIYNYIQQKNIKTAKLQGFIDLTDKVQKNYIEQFPLKKSVNEIAFAYNSLIKKNSLDNVLSFGIEYGWVAEYMDISSYFGYNYIPYHMNLGMGAHKGNAAIEEDFLLKDAFGLLVKAQFYFEKLKKFQDYFLQHSLDEKKLILENNYSKLTDVKFEIASLSRLCVISFYAFTEAFINSIGYSYYKVNIDTLNTSEIELLQGIKKNNFISLKSKIEKMHQIISKKLTIRTTDENQIKDPFKKFFLEYENLRNSAVHYSPLKDEIWMKPDDWITKAQDFSRLTLQVAIRFWVACYPNLGMPDYIGRLEYDKHIEIAKKRHKSLIDFESQTSTLQ